MKTTKPNWNMKKLQRMATSGELRFDYPIQRASGQWDALQKSLLIHSIAGDLPIPPVAIAKAKVNEQDGEFVIDGKQRTTTVLDFLSGVKDAETETYPETAYRLHEDTPDVELEGATEPFVLAGKYFDELDVDVQSEIQSASFLVQRLENATDEEIEEIFNRWNNGTPLTKQQKARGKMGTTNAVIIDKLQKHPFMKEVALFTPLQRRRSDDEAVIIQTLILMTKNDSQFESFVADKLLAFAVEMREADITDVTNALKDALDFVYSTEVHSPLFKKLHLPTLLLVAKKAKDEGVAPEVFGAWVEDFNNAINPRKRDNALVKTKYKNFMGAGSVKKNNVLGRKDCMITHFNEFIDRYEAPAVNLPKEPAKDVVEPNVEDELQIAKELDVVFG